ncbi:MAG: hypothetical protein KGJ79_09990 [Alphaproteobacteria bacterium]|nr:hypothetical protein [Alphaproteobacteria bacterium]MDE2494264.1 hypothetical protein [Alphaproteobacteria bacterium]
MGKTLRLIVYASFACSVLIGAAGAQPSDRVTVTMPTANGSIDASADQIVGDFESKNATLQGNVVIHDGTMSLRANSVRFHVTDNKIDKVFAKGKVVMDAHQGAATADDAVYDVPTKVVTLQGHVVLTRDKNVLRGGLLIYDLNKGVATLKGGPGERVQGLLVPKTDK